MADNFFTYPKEMQRAFLDGAATRLNLPPQIIEKDIWICWVLQKLFTLSFVMAFKGGTSLLYEVTEELLELSRELARFLKWRRSGVL